MDYHDPQMRRLVTLARALLILFTASVPVVAWALEVGVALTASHVLGFMVMLVAALLSIRSRRLPTVDLVTAGFAAFVLIATISVIRVYLEPDLVILGESIRAKALKQLLGLGFAFGVFVALRHLLETCRLGSTVLRAHFWTTVVVAALAIAQYGMALWNLHSVWAVFPVHNSTLGETRVLTNGVLQYGFPRVSFTLVEPSRLGVYLLTGWAFWLYAAQLRGGGRLAKRGFVWSGVLVGAAVLVTGSRVAHIVFALLVAGALVVRPYRLYRTALVAITLAVAATLVGPAKIGGVIATVVPSQTIAPDMAKTLGPVDPRLLPQDDGILRRVQDRLVDLGMHSTVSARHRIGSLVVAISVLRSHFWTGNGYGTSEFAMAVRYPRKMGQILTQPLRPTMLGLQITVLAETGVLGFLCFGAMLIGAYWTIWRSARPDDSARRAVAWGNLAALTAYGLAMTSQAIEIYQFLLVWLILATALAVSSEHADGLDLAPGVHGSLKNKPSTCNMRPDRTSVNAGRIA